MNRPPLSPEAQSIPQWQTIYCSLMLLLVVFFVMLIAYSAVDKNRFLQMKNVVRMEPDVSRPSPDMNQAMQSLKQLSVNGGMNNDFSVVRTQDGFKAVLPNPLLFSSGDASLDEGICPILDGIIKIAERDDLSIQVEGHTDNLPIHTEKFPSNWELSTMRAVNILRYFQQNGISPEDWRLSALPNIGQRRATIRRKGVKRTGGLKFFSGLPDDTTGSHKRNRNQNLADEFQ